MIKRSLSLLGLVFAPLLGGCGPGEESKPPTRTSLIVYNVGSAASLPLCPGGISARVKLAGQSYVLDKVVSGQQFIPISPAGFKKGNVLEVEATCFNADGSVYSRNTTQGSVQADYKERGQMLEVFIANPAGPLNGRERCPATDDANKFAPCILPNPELGLK